MGRRVCQYLLCFGGMVGSLDAAIIPVGTEAALDTAITTATAADTIRFTNDITILSPLPVITTSYIIDSGISNFTLDGSSAQRGFIVRGANPTIQNISFSDTIARGGNGGDAQNRRGGAGGGGLGAGGGLFIGDNSNVTLIYGSSDSFTNCLATGGNSPTPAGGNNSGGGGGGGLGGNGGRGDGGNDDGGGGGGGILVGDNGGNGTNNNGGAGAGGGGDGGDPDPPIDATPATYGGGGGGAASNGNNGSSVPSDGAFGGGGGGGASRPAVNRAGANGGYGGGGGGGSYLSGTGGTSIFGGGDGGTGDGIVGRAGGGGAALGGGIFVDPTSTLTIQMPASQGTVAIFSTLPVNKLTAGTGNAPGIERGQDIFLASGGSLTFDIGNATNLELVEPIESDGLGNGGGITKLGSGTLQFSSSANSYEGILTITAGIVEAGVSGSLGNVTSISLNGGELRAIGSFATSIPLTLDMNSTIAATTGNTLTLNGSITGANALTKTESGTVILTSAGNSYSGLTTVSAGTLRLTGSGGIGTGGLTINGATFEIASGAGTKTLGVINGASGSLLLNDNAILNSGSFSGSVSGTGGIQKQTAGTLTLDGAVSYGGLTNLVAGTLAIDAAMLNGSISGGGNLSKIGTGTLTLGAANSFTGSFTINNGIAAVTNASNLGFGSIVLNGGTLQMTGNFLKTNPVTVMSASSIDIPSGSINFGGTLMGTGSLSKTGSGTLIVSGVSTHTGPINVNAGTLVVQSSLASSSLLTVGTNGILQSLGDVGQLTNNGIIRPGTGLGTMVVNGTFTQSGSGLYEVELASDGSSDRITVNGTANLGGNVEVMPLGNLGFYQAGTTFTILSANTINNQFLPLINNSPLPIDIEYQPNFVVLTIPQDTLILPIDEITDDNARSVANFLVDCPFPDDQDLVEDFEALTMQTTAELQDSLLQISPLRFGDTLYFLLDLSEKIATMATAQSDLFFKPSHCLQKNQKGHVWIQPFINFIDQKQRVDRSCFRTTNYAILGGVDAEILSSTYVGLAGGASNSKVIYCDDLGTLKPDSGFLVLYGSYYFSNVCIHTSVVGSIASGRSERKVQFQGVDVTATSKPKFRTLSAQLGLSGRILNSSFSIDTSLDAYYINIWQMKFTETGGAPYNLQLPSQYYAYLRGVLGVKIMKNFQAYQRCFSPGLFLGWQNDFNLTPGTIRSKIPDICGDNTLKVRALYINKARVVIRPFFQVSNEEIHFKAQYELTLGSGYTEHKGSLVYGFLF